MDAVQIPDVIELMERWIAARSSCHFITFTGMQGITETQYDPSFKHIFNSADLVVADGRTGMPFTAGNADDLAAKVEWAWAHPEEMAAMGHAARPEYEAKYTPERNYEMLMEIYQRVLGARS
jgi:UDP-N-acetyl-D-mannosaminuronic acid transferase (WecB/TagA/CpsF family)